MFRIVRWTFVVGGLLTIAAGAAFLLRPRSDALRQSGAVELEGLRQRLLAAELDYAEYLRARDRRRTEPAAALRELQRLRASATDDWLGTQLALLCEVANVDSSGSDQGSATAVDLLESIRREHPRTEAALLVTELLAERARRCGEIDRVRDYLREILRLAPDMGLRSAGWVTVYLPSQHPDEALGARILALERQAFLWRSLAENELAAKHTAAALELCCRAGEAERASRIVDELAAGGELSSVPIETLQRAAAMLAAAGRRLPAAKACSLAVRSVVSQFGSADGVEGELLAIQKLLAAGSVEDAYRRASGHVSAVPASARPPLCYVAHLLSVCFPGAAAARYGDDDEPLIELTDPYASLLAQLAAEQDRPPADLLAALPPQWIESARAIRQGEQDERRGRFTLAYLSWAKAFASGCGDLSNEAALHLALLLTRHGESAEAEFFLHALEDADGSPPVLQRWPIRESWQSLAACGFAYFGGNLDGTAATAPATRSAGHRAALWEALAAVEDGDMAGAEEALNRALAAEVRGPTAGALRFVKAWLLEQRAAFAEAISVYRRAADALGSGPLGAEALAAVARVLKAQDRADDVAAVYEELARRYGPIGERRWAAYLESQGRYAEAVQLYRDMLENRPDQRGFAFEQIIRVYGEVWQAYGNAAEACAEWLRAEPDCPAAAATHFLLGRYLYEGQEYEKSCSVLAQHEELYPKSAWASPARMVVGMCFVEQGRFDEAAGLFQVLAQSADNRAIQAKALYLAAHCRIYQCRYDEAELLLGKLTSGFPDSPLFERARKQLESLVGRPPPRVLEQ